MGAKLQRPRVVSVQALVVEQGKLPRERSSRDQGQLQFKRWSSNEEGYRGSEAPETEGSECRRWSAPNQKGFRPNQRGWVLTGRLVAPASIDGLDGQSLPGEQRSFTG